jgi:prophage regulatory protein
MKFEQINNDEILRLRAVESLTGRKRSSIYEDMAAGRLPKSIKLGPRSVGWFRSDISLWQDARARERDLHNPPETVAVISRPHQPSVCMGGEISTPTSSRVLNVQEGAK